MPYFMACVHETLRVSPSTPVTLPRVVSDGGLVLNHSFIPPGTEVGANPYVINRDHTVFGTDADEFKPGRWLEDPERAKNMHKWMFTWGWGPRDCVGRPLARMLAQKLLLQVRLAVIDDLAEDIRSLFRLLCSFLKSFGLQGCQMKRDGVGATIEGCVSTPVNG